MRCWWHRACFSPRIVHDGEIVLFIFQIEHQILLKQKQKCNKNWGKAAKFRGTQLPFLKDIGSLIIIPRLPGGCWYTVLPLYVCCLSVTNICRIILGNYYRRCLKFWNNYCLGTLIVGFIFLPIRHRSFCIFTSEQRGITSEHHWNTDILLMSFSENNVFYTQFCSNFPQGKLICFCLKQSRS